jgi:Na+-transporting NADH:ubiquinone oxidoreductase subunit NqrE
VKTDEVLQWVGAVFIIAGHTLNSIGPSAYPWNIVAFFLGTCAFLAWTVRVANKPQMAVNVVALALGLVGLYNAFG